MLKYDIMKHPTVFGFYGKTDTGKTSLIVDIVKYLTDEGFNVSTVKITDKDISIDTEGKDTWRHSRAGSKLTILSSSTETDFLIKQNKKIDEIINYITDLGEYDVILVEGINDKKTPKIRLGDIKKRYNTILTYKGDFNGLIEIIKKEVSRGKNMKKINIKVNGKEIPLSEFPSDIIKNTICGMIKSLKGVDEIKTVEIKIKN